MLTLGDIDAKFPETHDGSVFSDLYKSVYGFRPRGYTFESMEDFDAEYKRLVEELKVNMAEDELREAANAEKFEARIKDIQEMMSNSREDAIRIIIQAEGREEDFNFYGYECLEYDLGLKFGYIKKSLEKETAQ